MTNDYPRREPGGDASSEAATGSRFLGRQPILDRSGALAAFELLFRSGTGNFAEVCDDSRATAHVLARTLGELGIGAVLGPQPGYVNICRDLLLDDIVHVMAPERFVLEILETVRFDARLFERCARLREAGFTFALDDVASLSPNLLSILPYVDIVKVDFVLCDRAGLPELADVIKRHGKVLIAEKIETQADHQLALDLGFDLFQGYFFAYPQILASSGSGSSSQALRRLLPLLAGQAEGGESGGGGEGADAGDLEAELRLNPALVMQLVRLSDSSAFGHGRDIASLGEAIAALGPCRIARWVQLLLRADGREALPCPPRAPHTAHPPQPPRADLLAQQAGTRARFMELAATYLRPKDDQFAAAAFMAGIFSLAHRMFDDDVRNTANLRQLTGDIQAAIMSRRGPLGLLLELAVAAEGGVAEPLCRAHAEFAALSPPVIAELTLSAGGWLGARAAV